MAVKLPDLPECGRLIETEKVRLLDLLAAQKDLQSHLNPPLVRTGKQPKRDTTYTYLHRLQSARILLLVYRG